MPLTEDWSAARTEAGTGADMSGIAELAWHPATVPGTAAATALSLGSDPLAVDAEDWWFRTRLRMAPARPDEQLVLCLDGLATLAEVFVNGRRCLTSQSMFERHEIDLGDLSTGDDELAICFRALAPELAIPRKPRARWRTRVVADGGLRWFRTMLLGRAPGFAPGPPAVGPWRPIVVERRRGLVVDDLWLRPRVDGKGGTLTVDLRFRRIDGLDAERVVIRLDGPTGPHEAELALTRDDSEGHAQGDLIIPGVQRWWPHTHGFPALYDADIRVGVGSSTVVIDAGRIGFRSLAAGPSADHDVEHDGLDLHVNDVRVFARGAVWTPVDPIGLAISPDEMAMAIDAARDAGMNMLRLPGTGVYESDVFHDLCDARGMLVWQDLMFANMDYPFDDDAFRSMVEREVTEVIDGLAGRPSLAVVCGNSEIEQQAAMLGLDPGIGRGPFFGESVPRILAAAEVDAVYVPSAPSGVDLPFRPDTGVANYYGVGGYRRPLADARLSGVRFAAECLALANVPDETVVDALLAASSAGSVIDQPRWKAGVARDVGADWDFDDVRDHYLAELFGVDPGELCRSDPDRYLELSRAVSGEVMAEVFGDWRRATSTCHGGLVLWLRDLVPGAGWGVLDQRGLPKVAYHHLRRILAPVAVWLTDEGLNGVAIHLANDRPTDWTGTLRIALYRDHEQPVARSEQVITLAAHATLERNVEALLGHFVDASWAYRFGPPGHDAIVATLERDGPAGPDLVSQAFRYPAGRPTSLESAGRLGLTVTDRVADDGTVQLTIGSRRLAYGVRIHADGYRPDDDAFSVEPGGTRLISLRPLSPASVFGGASLSALNLVGRVGVDQVGR